MTGFMYILRCRDGSYYVGSTTSGDYRIQQHKDGLGGDYTRRRLPVELVYGEEFPTLHKAFLAERQVKGWSRLKKEALIRGDYDALPELSWNSVRRAQELARRQAVAVSNVTQSDDVAAYVLRRAQDAVSE